MSDATRAAAETAIRAHVLDEGEGAMLVDWVFIASAAMADDPDATMYVSEGSDGPMHTRWGLVRYLHKRTEQHFMEDEDD